MTSPLRPFRFFLLPAVALALLVAPGSPAQSADDFSAQWHDGKAEINGYELRVDRYGEVREGQAVMIFVTEPLRLSTRVKADDSSVRPEDVADVLKLNLVRDFQTGIYDYNTMTSVFARSSDFETLKVSFSSAEWCGHVYSETVFHPDRVDLSVRSYFEGENAAIQLERTDRGVAEEGLFIRLRGLRGAFLAPGESVQVPVLLSSFVQRLGHRTAEWMNTTIQRARDTKQLTVPAGDFECMIYEVHFEDGRNGEFAIEVAPPHRIIRWSLGPDVEGRLTGTLRTPYWQQKEEGAELLLEQLGLQPVVRNSSDHD
jgi:hypothetical protein